MKAKSNSVMGFEVFLQLTEAETRALNSLTVYGHKSFLEMFYKHLGEGYLMPHEEGLISLFESIGQQLPKHISRIDKTRKVFKENNPNP